MASGADLPPRPLTLELLTDDNAPQVQAIDRSDVPAAFVDTPDALMALTRYGTAHGCLGHTYAICYGGISIGLILLGEAIPWETDPPQMQREPFYRLMGFVLDRRYRSCGLGGCALEMAIARIYDEFGVRPIALGCHEENVRAAAFYQRHGFIATDAFEGHDRYYLRYPN